jgi:hypothetical protein
MIEPIIDIGNITTSDSSYKTLTSVPTEYSRLDAGAYSGDREQGFRRKANSSPDDDEQLSGRWRTIVGAKRRCL